MIPNTVLAESNFNEYPPYIRLSNYNDYDVEKIIDKKNVTVRIRKKNQKTYYSWTFDKEKVGNTIDIDFEVNFESNKEALINNLAGNGKKKIISFKHHGALPSNAKITIYVGDEYKNGENLNLYYLDEKENKIEMIDRNIKVVSGYVEFEIEHCSDYFLTTNILSDEDVNKEIPINMNYIIMGMCAIALFLVVKTMATAR